MFHYTSCPQFDTSKHVGTVHQFRKLTSMSGDNFVCSGQGPAVGASVNTMVFTSEHGFKQDLVNIYLLTRFGKSGTRTPFSILTCGMTLN